MVAGHRLDDALDCWIKQTRMRNRTGWNLLQGTRGSLARLGFLSAGILAAFHRSSFNHDAAKPVPGTGAEIGALHSLREIVPH